MMTSGGTVGAAAAGVPSGIEGVTPQWLTAALDGATVTDVRVEQIALDSGFSSQLYRAHLSGEGVPNSVIVKLPAVSEAGDAMKMLGGYAREVAFYRHVAGRAPMGTPVVHAIRMDEGTADFVLVLEDLQRLGQRRPSRRPVAGPRALLYSRTGRPARVVDQAAEYRCRWRRFRASTPR